MSNRVGLAVNRKKTVLYSLLEKQGFKLDRTAKAENFYYLTNNDRRLVLGVSTKKRTEGQINAVWDAEMSFQSSWLEFLEADKNSEKWIAEVDRVLDLIEAEEDKLDQADE